jgi:hypothetical protein
MQYQTVFDLTVSGYRTWSFAAFGLIFVAIGLWMVLRPNSEFMLHFVRKRWFSWVFIAFSLLWTAVSFWSTFGEYRELRSALQSGAAMTTAGLVENFRPKISDQRGSAPERFCVKTECFEYSDYVVTSGFNQTRMRDGPVREGLSVRVTSYKGKIVKLEVAGE